jgi:glutathione S-transferase
MHQIQPTLYISLRSPFARRIRLALHRLNISYDEKTVDVFQDNPDLLAANPLGLVPTLKTADGPITDSANILEYLDETHGGIWPEDPRAKINARQISVWSEGVMQSLVLYFQEAKMHEVPSPRWEKEHSDTIEATLSYLDEAPKDVWFTTEPASEGLTQAAWDLCVALEYMDLRLAELNWRAKYPGFMSILEAARKNSYFCETTPPA